MEGLFDPQSFSLPLGFSRERLLGSIVKVRPLRTLEYAVFSNGEEASAFSETIVDSEGFETIRVGITEGDFQNCSDPEVSEALFTHELCELFKSGASFPAKASLKGNGNGVLISGDGYIATNYHLVSGAVSFLGFSQTGYRAASNLEISNVEVEIFDCEEDGIYKYRKVSGVSLAGTYSEKDAYGNRLDLAILKINEVTPNYLKLAEHLPQKYDQIFSIGFSMRSARDPERKRLLGYEDANYDLRISTGLIVKVDGDNSFLSDSDGAPGNSGSAAINNRGELIGIYSGSTGNGIVDPSKAFRRFVFAQKMRHLLASKEG